jgi:hypothetical protein
MRSRVRLGRRTTHCARPVTSCTGNALCISSKGRTTKSSVRSRSPRGVRSTRRLGVHRRRSKVRSGTGSTEGAPSAKGARGGMTRMLQPQQRWTLCTKTFQALFGVLSSNAVYSPRASPSARKNRSALSRLSAKQASLRGLSCSITPRLVQQIIGLERRTAWGGTRARARARASRAQRRVFNTYSDESLSVRPGQ